MNFSAILFRDIKLLFEFSKYVIIVFTENAIISFFVFCKRVPQVLCLTRQPTRGRKVSNAPKLLNLLFISTERPKKASLRRAATSVVELWPGVSDCCKSLCHSFGVLFPFEEWLGFVTVFVTTAFFEASEPVEGTFSLFFCCFASHLGDFVGSLDPVMGSASFHSGPPCFSACVLLDPAESFGEKVLCSSRSNWSPTLSRALANSLW